MPKGLATPDSDPRFAADCKPETCVKFRRFLLPVCHVLVAAPLSADWKEEIGYIRLQTLAGAELPTTSSQGFTQVEAYYPNTSNYAPDVASALFAGKTFVEKSGASGASAHAQQVAENFYGTGSLQPGACGVDLYELQDWVNSGFLNYGGAAPIAESRAVQNHSWAGSFGNSNADTEVSRRLDYAIDRDGFVCAVGLFNEDGNHPVHAQLLCQTYNTISVGRDDGLHTKGVTTLDGNGRYKPDIVAPSAYPNAFTSFTTPMVASAAGLLHAKLSGSPYSLTGADRPRVIKALLMASARKDTVPAWDNTSSRPLDEVYGAGELNILHAYTALRAGKKTAGSTQHGIRGWAAESVNGGANKTYFFSIPAGAPSTPFCAALTWHRVVSDGLPGPGWGNLSSSLANLSLRLYQASGTTTGSLVSSSLSSVDNVELIYQAGLAPGDYALQVENSSGNSTAYALAWHSLPAVTVAASQPTAREIDGQQGSVTFTRTGDTTLPLYVPLAVGGTSVAGSHYQTLPAGITIPAGQASASLQIIPIADFLAQGDRTVTVAAAADFALVRDPALSAAVTIEDKPFDQWRFTHFTPTELADPAIGGTDGDADGDQLANLIEYALGFDPHVPDVSPVAMIDSSGYLALSTAKGPFRSDIAWSAETGGDLNGWLPAIIVTNTSSDFVARDTVLMNAAEKRFIRLKITRQ